MKNGYKLQTMNSDRVFVVRDALFTVGNSSDADAIIEGLSATLALQFQMKDEFVTVVKLGKEPVLVNDAPIDAARLKHNDTVSCENFSVIFLDSQDEIQLNKQEHRALREIDNAEIIKTLSDLIDSVLLTSNRGTVMQHVLSLGCDFMIADHGVLSITENKKEVELFYPADTKISISSTAVKKSVEQGTAIVWSRDASDETIDLSTSIIKNKLSSIIVSPFSIEDKIEGYLYIQRESKGDNFTNDDAELFNGFVHIVTSLLKAAFNSEDQKQEIEQLKGVQRKGVMLYSSEGMGRVVTVAEKVAQKLVPVLINGETGTGKEVLARYIHECSPIKEKRFIAVNCGAIPPNLIESELFGHVKGAFTGAVENKKGIFQECDGGTLFLDEIGELDLHLQVSLLRVLQEKKVTPVGSSKEVPVEFRLLSATHVNLEEAVQTKNFREDLYFRINVMQLKIPPLRERGQDVLLLARHFLARYLAEYSMSGIDLSKNAEKTLLKHRWNGNVRELENRIHKALIQCDTDAIQDADLGLESSEIKERSTLKEAKEAAERDAVTLALTESKGNLTLAGTILGVDRKVLREILVRLDLDKANFK